MKVFNDTKNELMIEFAKLGSNSSTISLAFINYAIPEDALYILNDNFGSTKLALVAPATGLTATTGWKSSDTSIVTIDAEGNEVLRDRYQLNDVVRVKSVENGVPVFSYEYDMKQTITVGGIHLTEKMIGDCIISMKSELNLPVTDYAYMENENENGIVIMLEIQNDDVSGIDTQKLAKEFERNLENNNPEYHDVVSAGKVVKPEIVLIEQETQLLYRDVLMFRLKFPPDFIKPVRYINSPMKERFFKSRVIHAN